MSVMAILHQSSRLQNVRGIGHAQVWLSLTQCAFGFIFAYLGVRHISPSHFEVYRETRHYSFFHKSFGCTMLAALVRQMKNLPEVLYQKEKDAERVRREIQALLVVIPLLADAELVADHKSSLCSSLAPVESSDNDMAALETYFPFIRHRRSKRF